MKIAVIASNINKISSQTKQGTAIFISNLVGQLVKTTDVTLYCSLDSEVPVKKSGIINRASSEDSNIGIRTPNTYFDSALISKALQEDQHDLYHFNNANGELILPFAKFIKKPILITPHGSLDNKHAQKYFKMFEKLDNVYFVGISEIQKKPLPFLNYISTIYHGIDLSCFKYNEQPTGNIIWAGRGVPEKGLDDVITVIKATGKNATILPILKSKYVDWIKNEILKERNLLKPSIIVRTNFDINRLQLVPYYQQSKLFLNPIKWEEPFGLVMIEAMACGTPVVAYARGSVPEIIKDGVTGFIVNSSKKDIRGNFIIKKTGIEGLVEAVNRIYAMPEKEYLEMRLACRQHVEKNFTIERMVNEYIQTYKDVIADYNLKKSKITS